MFCRQDSTQLIIKLCKESYPNEGFILSLGAVLKCGECSIELCPDALDFMVYPPKKSDRPPVRSWGPVKPRGGVGGNVARFLLLCLAWPGL